MSLICRFIIKGVPARHRFTFSLYGKPDGRPYGKWMNVTNQNGFPMDIRELTARMNRFVEAMGWYAPDSPKPQTPENLSKSLVLEAGEVLEHFQWDSSDPDLEAISSELADVLLYTLQIASVLGIDLEQVTLSKLNNNYDRSW